MTNWRDSFVFAKPEEVDDIFRLQTKTLAALPDKRWYFASSREELLEECKAGRVIVVKLDGEIIAYSIARSAHEHLDTCYAARVGHDCPQSLDFQDIIVDPAHQRQGIHSAFLAYYEEEARRHGYHAIYATVDPDNMPSCSSFEKAGYGRVVVQPAYDGRIRAYYRLGLD